MVGFSAMSIWNDLGSEYHIAEADVMLIGRCCACDSNKKHASYSWKSTSHVDGDCLCMARSIRISWREVYHQVVHPNSPENIVISISFGANQAGGIVFFVQNAHGRAELIFEYTYPADREFRVWRRDSERGRWCGVIRNVWEGGHEEEIDI
jgi:hypothetical protein